MTTVLQGDNVFPGLPLPAMQSPLAVGTPRPSAGFALRTAPSSCNPIKAELKFRSIFKGKLKTDCSDIGSAFGFWLPPEGVGFQPKRQSEFEGVAIHEQVFRQLTTEPTQSVTLLRAIAVQQAAFRCAPGLGHVASGPVYLRLLQINHSCCGFNALSSLQQCQRLLVIAAGSSLLRFLQQRLPCS
jgi:hypothetical protein